MRDAQGFSQLCNTDYFLSGHQIKNGLLPLRWDHLLTAFAAVSSAISLSVKYRIGFPEDNIRK